jgi:NAD(P)-dependent dehydrogenase (short-subunit alcohol dehydrogenase family)
MDLGIQGRWALVCGASKGLGFGCAQALAEAGVHIVLNARSAEPLSQAATAIREATGVTALPFCGARWHRGARGSNDHRPVAIPRKQTQN